MTPLPFIRALFCACACACALTFSLASQALAEDEFVTVQFVRVPAAADDLTAEVLQKDGSTVEVELPCSALTEPYRMAKPKKWVLGRKGKEGFEELGSAPVQEGGKQIIVVVTKGAKEEGDEAEEAGGKFDLISIGDVAAASSYLFVNASRHEISGEVDIERFGIAPMEHALIKPDVTEVDQHGRKFCDVTLSFSKGKDVVPYINGSWRLEKNLFGIIVFHHEAVADKLKMTVFREFIE